MASRLSFVTTVTNTILVLLVLLESVLVLDQVRASPVHQNQRNDILAGTEFLSVFINGAMAPVPVGQLSPRRRGFRRGGSNGLHSTMDSLPAESKQSEAPIYRISRAPSSPRPFVVSRSGHRDQESDVRFYPINHKTMDSRDNANHDTVGAGNLIITSKQGQEIQQIQRIVNQSHQSNGTKNSINILKTRLPHVNQKVIGVSVTSTVEATPYKVRVEHHDTERKFNVVTRPPLAESISTETFVALTETTLPITSTTLITSTDIQTTVKPITKTSTTTVTQLPAQLVTEELSNIVSESNRSEFSVDEGLPKTSWPNRSPTTTTTRGSIDAEQSVSTSSPSSSFSTVFRSQPNKEEPHDSLEASTSLKPSGQRYEVSVEINKESEIPLQQGRKVGRQYDAIIYNEPPEAYTKMYGKSSGIYDEITKNRHSSNNYGDVYSEPAKIYSEPSKIYGEPSKIYGEPAKVYGEPEKFYGEPSKVYSEPSRVYGEPAKIYGEPAKVYGEPSKIYGPDGRPVITHKHLHHHHHHHHHNNHHRGEPVEENYEIDEAVSVGSNGNVHGLQVVTESTEHSSTKPSSTDSTLSKDSGADGHKVGYVVDERNYRKYRVEERTPDGFIVGEYGVVSHDDGSLRGVRYTADGTTDPRLIYDALMKFLAL